MILNPFGVGKSSNGDIYKTVLGQNEDVIKTIREELNQISKESGKVNKNGNTSLSARIKNFFKSYFTSQAQVELSVSDEQFKTRLADDQKLIETFFSKIKEAGNNKIDIDGILKDLNIGAENHANLFEYLSGQDADSLSKLEDASRLTKSYAASQDELRVKTAGATVKLVAMKAATVAANMAISLGLSIAVDLLIKGLTKLATHAQEYYDGIEALRKKYFASNEKYIDKDRSLQEELFDLGREISQKRVSDLEHEIYLLEQREEIEKSRIDSAEDAGKIDLTQYKNIENQKLQYYIKIREETNRQLRAAYAYGLDDHSDYVQELQKQWYEANQNMIQVYEDLLSTLESKRDNFQSQQSSMLDAYLNVLEKEKSALEDQKKEEEEYWKERIDNYKKEHDEQEKTNELEEKRLKLLNIKNQKNVLMYDKEKGWIRTYDHSAYDEAKKDYDKALADKEYNDELERLENERDAALDSIQNQIDSIEKLRDTYKDKFDEITDILGMTEDQLKSLDEFTKMSAEDREKYLESFVNNFKSKMEEMIAEINKVKDAVKFTQNGINDIFGYANSKPGVVSDDYRVYKDKTTGAGTMIKNSDITWRGKTPSQAQIDEWEKAGWRYAGDGGWWKEGKKYYAMGGVVEDTGIAKLHGDKVHSEVVFNAADAKKLYDYIHNTPSLILDLSKKLFANNSPNPKPTTALAANGGSGEQHFHIGQLSFPNATDGQDVIDTIRELPNYFLQHKYKK